MRTLNEAMMPRRWMPALCVASMLVPAAVCARDGTAVSVSVNVTGGSAEANVDAAALANNEGNIQISVHNGQKVPWNDLTVSLVKKGTGSGENPQDPGIGAGNLKNGEHDADDMTPTSHPSGGKSVEFGPGTSTTNFGPALSPSGNLTVLLTGCSAGDYGEVTVKVTPSTSMLSAETNMFGDFALSSETDLIQNVNPDTWHGQVAGVVINTDSNQAYEIDALDGRMTLPAGILVTSVSVRQNTDGFPAHPSASTQVLNGTDFKITGLSLGRLEQAVVVVGLNQDVGGDLTKMRLQIHLEQAPPGGPR